MHATRSATAQLPATDQAHDERGCMAAGQERSADDDRCHTPRVHETPCPIPLFLGQSELAYCYVDAAP